MKIRFKQPLRGITIATTVACGLLAAAGPASAQAPGQKPFQDIYRRPAVSAYNQIANFGDNPQMAGNIYQQIIMPQQQQQRQQLELIEQGRQVGKIQGQVKQMQQSSQTRQLDETIRPTGHASTYMNYSHYYPQR
jgi:hypothetical protein